MSTVATPTAQTAAAAASLASRWWSRPLPHEVQAWTESWPQARDLAAALAVDTADVERLERAAGDSSVDELLEEYEHLFVGPGQAPCPPYESLWRADAPRREQGTLMGSAAEAVVKLYRELGVSVRTEARELPDHVAIEWEAVAYGLQGRAEIAAKLLDEHLAVWVPLFSAAVEAEATLDFYQALASLMPAWLTAVAAGV